MICLRSLKTPPYLPQLCSDAYDEPHHMRVGQEGGVDWGNEKKYLGKAPAATFQDRKAFFQEKKAPAATHQDQKRAFFNKKTPHLNITSPTPLLPPVLRPIIIVNF